MKKNTKTNAARILDRLSVSYELLTYEVDENDLGAENVAGKLGIDIQQAVKTLVAKGDKTGIVIACLPGDKELDLKKLAAISHNKRVELVPLKDVLGLTGYIRGGVSPLGMKKTYPTYFEASILDKANIICSAGLRGVQLYLVPNDLVKAVNGVVGDIVTD